MIKRFEEFINENLNEPIEFTGDPNKDRYLNAAIYRNGEEKLHLNFKFNDPNDFSKTFNPFIKAQEEGNKYNEIWKNLVNWIKNNKDFENESIINKDRILLSTFNKILKSQRGIESLREIQRQNWKTYNYNRCKEKWEKLTKLSFKIYPDKKDSFQRAQFVRNQFEKFIEGEGIYKYAKYWIPEFSRIYKVD